MLLLFSSLAILVALNTPIAFALLVSSLLYIFADGSIPLTAIAQRMVAGPNSFPLLAVPFFILAGSLMNMGGITNRIFDFAKTMVGHFRGALGHVNIVASIIFSGMSGAAIADAGGLGTVEIKAMTDEGYDDDFSVAITAASSIIGPIIPPSIPAVVYGVLANVSVGRLLIAGIVPGLIMAVALSVMVYFYAKNKNYKVYERSTFKEFLHAFKESFLPILTPVIIIGGILSGVFTPTEAAVIAAVYAFILSTFIYREMNVRKFLETLKTTVKTSSSVMLIVASASLFGWILAREQLPQLLADTILNITQNPYLILFMINILLLIVGCFMETIAAMTILVPFLAPLVLAVNIDPLHFGIVLILNLMIGLLTPPLGMVLYVLVNVADTTFERAVKATFPFLIPLIVTLLLITYVPEIVTFLPNLLLPLK